MYTHKHQLLRMAISEKGVIPLTFNPSLLTISLFSSYSFMEAAFTMWITISKTQFGPGWTSSCQVLL